MEENISTFVAITGSGADVARGFLEMAGGDFERAVALFYENPDLVSGVGAAASQAQQAGTSSRGNIGREDESGVIHIDSDDDDMKLDNDSDDDDTNMAVAQAAALAQEEEDAAMAKRLQEELYSGTSGGGAGGAGGAGDDDVRAPIARTTETLVAPDPTWGADDDMGSHILDQLRRQRQAAGMFEKS